MRFKLEDVIKYQKIPIRPHGKRSDWDGSFGHDSHSVWEISRGEEFKALISREDTERGNVGTWEARYCTAS